VTVSGFVADAFCLSSLPQPKVNVMTDHATTGTAHAVGLLRNRVLGPKPERGASMRRLAMVWQAVAAGTRACLRLFVASLHESRSRKAAIELARYRHLYKVGPSFAVQAPAQKNTPAE
jgi:hypothetical protein